MAKRLQQTIIKTSSQPSVADHEDSDILSGGLSTLNIDK